MKYKSFQEFAQALADAVIGTPCTRCGRSLERGDDLAIEYGPNVPTSGSHRSCRPQDTEIAVAIR